MFVLEVIYAVAIFFSNPINLFPVYEIIYKMKWVETKLKGFTPKKQFYWKFFMRVIVMMICFFICYFVPNFINFLSFVGSFLFPILGIYIPVLLNYSYFKRKGDLTLKRKVLLIALLVVSGIIFTFCTIDSLTKKHQTDQ